MGFCFIHTADLHLDAPLKALALRDPDLADEVATASRQTLSNIIDLCIEERAAFLMIAGDLWDGTASTKTPRFLKQELLRLKAHGIRAYLIRGNHDALARQTGELELPDNAVLFGPKASTEHLDIDGHHIALHGLSFKEAHAPASFLPQYPAAVAGAFNIGLMHTSLNGSAHHDPYAPCSLLDLQDFGYQYWALGHIHRRAVYPAQHAGQATVVMPGIAQGRDIGEAGPASVTLVRVTDSNDITLEPRNVALLRFETLEIDCSGLHDWSALLNRLEASITEAAQAPREERHLALRLHLIGQTDLQWQMVRDLDVLDQEARSFAEFNSVWIDKLKLNFLQDLSRPSPLPAGLIAAIMTDIEQDLRFQREMHSSVEMLQKALPKELRNLLGKSPEEVDALCANLLQEGRSLVLNRLHIEEPH